MPPKEQSTSANKESTSLDLLNRYTSYGVRAHVLNDETINKLAETFKAEFPEATGYDKIKTNFRATDLPFLLKHFLNKLINGEENFLRTDQPAIVQLQSEFSTSYANLPDDIRQLECVTKSNNGNTQITFLAIKQSRGEGWDRLINLLPFSNEAQSIIEQSIPPGTDLTLPSDDERREALLNSTDDKRVRLQALLLGKNYWFGRQDFTNWEIKRGKIYHPDPRNPQRQIELVLQGHDKPRDKDSEWNLFGKPYIEERGDGPFVTKTSKANIDSMDLLVKALPIYRFLQGSKVSGFDGLRSLTALAAHECNIPRNLMTKKNKHQIQVRDVDLETGECKKMPDLPDEVRELFWQLRKKHYQLGTPLGSGFFDYGDIPAVENAIEAAWNRLNKTPDEVLHSGIVILPSNEQAKQWIQELFDDPLDQAIVWLQLPPHLIESGDLQNAAINKYGNIVLHFNKDVDGEWKETTSTIKTADDEILHRFIVSRCNRKGKVVGNRFLQRCNSEGSLIDVGKAPLTDNLKQFVKAHPEFGGFFGNVKPIFAYRAYIGVRLKHIDNLDYKRHIHGRTFAEIGRGLGQFSAKKLSNDTLQLLKGYRACLIKHARSPAKNSDAVFDERKPERFDASVQSHRKRMTEAMKVHSHHKPASAISDQAIALATQSNLTDNDSDLSTPPSLPPSPNPENAEQTQSINKGKRPAEIDSAQLSAAMREEEFNRLCELHGLAPTNTTWAWITQDTEDQGTVRLLTLFDRQDPDMPLFVNNEAMQFTEEYLRHNNFNINAFEPVKRLRRRINPQEDIDSDVHMTDINSEEGEENLRQISSSVDIKEEPQDDHFGSRAEQAQDQEFHTVLIDPQTNTYILSWRIPLFEEADDGFQEGHVTESMRISDQPEPNFRWPIRDPLRPSRIHPDYAADEEGLVLHENCECREVRIHHDQRKKIVDGYKQAKEEGKLFFVGDEAAQREDILTSYLETQHEIEGFLGRINPTRMAILESYVKTKKDLEDMPTGIYFEEGQWYLERYDKAQDDLDGIDIHSSETRKEDIESAFLKAKSGLKLFLAGGIDYPERRALLKLYEEAERDPQRILKGMDANEREERLASYARRRKILESYAEAEKNANRLLTAIDAQEKKSLLAAHVKAKAHLKQFFTEIDAHERERLLALYAEAKRHRERFFSDQGASDKNALLKMYGKREKLLADHAKADTDLISIFTYADPEAGKRMVKQFKTAEANLDDYFTEREAKIKEIWNCSKEGRAAPAAQMFDTPRLDERTTRSAALIGQFGRRPKKHDDQPLLEVVDAWVHVGIHVEDFKMLEVFVDKYGKDRLENYAMRGSEDTDGNSFLFVPVRTGHPSALMNDEYPPVDQEGKIIPGKQRGDMMSFEAEVWVTNKYRKTNGMERPHTIQRRPTEFPYETTLGYTLTRLDEYWLDRHNVAHLKTRENFNTFYTNVNRRLCGRELMVAWRKKTGLNTNEAFLRDVIENCKTVMSEPSIDGRNPKIVEGEWDRREFRVWENWHIKGFKTTIADRPVTVFLSFSDRMGTRIDDMCILEEATPVRESYQAMFKEMRSKAVRRLCQKTVCLPGFPLIPPPPVKQELTPTVESMQQANVTTIPLRGASDTNPPPVPVTASHTEQTGRKSIPRRAKGRK